MGTCICPPTTYVTGGRLNSIGSLDRVRMINTIDRINGIYRVENIEPIRFCHWNASKAGAGGSLAEASFYSAALIAVATINTIAQWQIAQERYKIAKEYANIAKDRWNRFKNGYMPLEIAMLTEVSTTPEYKANYLKARNDYSGWTSLSYAELVRRLGEAARKYHICVDETIARDAANAEALATVDGVNFGYRYEEYREINRNDDRWNRRSALLNLGRDLHAQSAKYASYANDILAGLGAMASEGTAGAVQMLGYLRERQNTYYPQQFSGIGTLSDGTEGMFAPAQVGMSWS